MRLVVDDVLCVGHGVCADVAPELFEVGADGLARVLVDDVTPEHLANAELAMRRCPAEAITLVR